MKILILENPIQDWLSNSCRSFQLYFYKNLFDPHERSQIQNHQTLTKETLQTMTNEIFATDADENECLIKNLNEEYNL